MPSQQLVTGEMRLALPDQYSQWRDNHQRFDWAECIRPGSFLLWLVAGWMALYIVRPWEILIPQLEVWRFERFYCLFVLAVAVASGRLKVDLSRQTMALGLLLASMAVSTVYSINSAESADALYKMLTLYAAYVVVLAAVNKPKHLVFLSLAYVAIMACYLAKCEWEYFIHDRADFAMGVKRLQGINITHGHPNGVASTAVLSMPFWYFLWQRRRELYASVPPLKRRLLRFAMHAYCAIALSAVLLTNSRSGMLGFAIFIFLSSGGGNSVKRRLPRIMGAAMLVLFLWMAVMPETQKNRLRTLWDPNAGPKNAQTSVEGRFDAAVAGFKMLQQQPMTGVGLGQFKTYRRYHLHGYELENALSSHNLFSRTLGEQGVLGGFALLLVMAALYANYRRVCRLTRISPSEELSLLHSFGRVAIIEIILLILFGVCGDALHFNYFWLAAVGVAMLSMTLSAIDSRIGPMAVYEPWRT